MSHSLEPCLMATFTARKTGKVFGKRWQGRKKLISSYSSVKHHYLSPLSLFPFLFLKKKKYFRCMWKRESDWSRVVRYLSDPISYGEDTNMAVKCSSIKNKQKNVCWVCNHTELNTHISTHAQIQLKPPVYSFSVRFPHPGLITNYYTEFGIYHSHTYFHHIWLVL